MFSEMQRRLAVPIPKLLRTRPRDKRGYPVPFIVLIDEKGRPQFTINDIRKMRETLSKRLCGLCGRRLERDVWFIGGVRNYTLPQGAFLDPPNHLECAEYALRVCPYLAAPNYNKSLEDQAAFGVLRDATRPVMIVHHDNPAGRPEVFGLGATHTYEFRAESQVYKVDRWEFVEWWRDGVTVNAPDR